METVDTIADNFIVGTLQRSPRLSPATAPWSGEQIGVYSDDDGTHARAAIEAARTAFDSTGWAQDRQLRARVLGEMAQLMARREDELVRVLALDNGKAIRQARSEVRGATQKLRYYAALTLLADGTAAHLSGALSGRAVPEPMGVAGIITPWNSPVILAVRSFAAALAAGCTVAMKMPGETGMLSGQLHRLFAETPSLPAGVLNSFTESANVGAPLLVADPRVDVISYTGSTEVGAAIMAQAATNLKRLVLELGGKTPCLVFDDADLERAVPALVAGMTTFAGQFCMAGTRILVHQPIADQLRERLVEALGKVRMGPSLEEDTDLGPVINLASAMRIRNIVAAASEYATVLVPAGVPEDPALKNGSYVCPALLEVDSFERPLVQEEVFGPVATFETFVDEQAAIDSANATRYGLACSIWTRDLGRATRVGQRVRAGLIWTNTWADIPDQFPVGGLKHSGLGRLGGPDGMAAFQEVKTYLHRIG